MSSTKSNAAALLTKLLNDYGVNFASSFLGFVIIMLAARLLGAADFAWISAGVAFGSFLTPLSSLGSGMTFVRDAVAAGDRRAVELMAAKTLGMRLTVMIALFGVLLLCAPFYAGSVENGVAVALVAAWAGMQGLYPAGWFDYIQETRVQNRLVFAERIIALVLVACLWLLPETLHYVLVVGLVLLASRLISVAVQVRTWTAMFRTRDFRYRLALPKKNPGIDIPVTAALVSNALFVYGPQLFLANNRTELASYGLAFQIVGLIFVFQSQALRLVSVTIAEACKRRDQILRSTLRTAILIGGGSAILSIFVFIVIQYLPLLLSDPGFDAAKNVAPALCVWIVIAGAGIAVAQHVVVLNQQTFYFVSSMVAGPAGLLLAAIFVPEYGARAVVSILLVVHSLQILANLGRLVAVSTNQPKHTSMLP